MRLFSLVLAGMLLWQCALGEDAIVKVPPRDAVGKSCPEGQHWAKGNYGDDTCPKNGGMCGMVLSSNQKWEDYDYYYCEGKKKQSTDKERIPVVSEAVQEKYLAHKKGDICEPLGQGDSANLVSNGMACQYGEDQYKSRYTCSNKSDFLLTSEDGTKHVCVRF